MTDNPKIEYRHLTPDEKLYLERLQGFVFSFTPDEKDIREKIAKNEYKCDGTYGAVDGRGRILAGMEVVPYTMWFDGHKVPMGGIGGVASVPESRRQSNIRRVFEKVFEDMRENGTVFSHLYPFSHDFYRKFGYEHCGGAKRYTLPVAPARRLKNLGSAHEYIKGDAVRGKLTEVYEAYASRHNAMVSRSEASWDKIFDMPLFGADRLYYWADAEGEVKAWAKFKKENDEVRISDIAWADHESMLGILQFIGMFEGAAGKMVITASPEFIPEIYWNNLYEINTENSWLGMSRVVDARRVLELMKKPEREGKFTIKVEDGFAKWNDNTYEVEFGGGDCAVKTVAHGADIEVTERALAQMALGVYGLEEISRRDDVRVNGNAQTLGEVFCRKNVLLADFF